MTTTKLNSLLSLRKQFLGFIQRRVNDRTTAEDILQIAYLRALQAASQLRQEESSVAWFYRILRNAIIDHYRRSSSEEAALGRWIKELKTEPANQQYEPLLHETTCQCIAGALDRITPAYASLLREVDLGETPLSAYAKSAEITPGNAAVRAHRARTALRNQLIRCCGTCAEHGCIDCTCKATAALIHQPTSL